MVKSISLETKLVLHYSQTYCAPGNTLAALETKLVLHYSQTTCLCVHTSHLLETKLVLHYSQTGKPLTFWWNYIGDQTSFTLLSNLANAERRLVNIGDQTSFTLLSNRLSFKFEFDNIGDQTSFTLLSNGVKRRISQRANWRPN